MPRRSPIGVQFMVYASILGLVLVRADRRIVLPATPNLASVIVARGVLAGVMVFLAAGVGYVRGACNGLQGNRGAGMRRMTFALAALVLGMGMVPLIASVSNADGLDGLVTAEAESYALRVEYDIPLPAGPGDVPHTSVRSVAPPPAKTPRALPRPRPISVPSSSAST